MSHSIRAFIQTQRVQINMIRIAEADALAAAMENRKKAIDAFMDAAMERRQEMMSFDCGDDPVVAMMWTLIEELEG